eukprot:Hpha_TRINITY_DN14138_c0_g1::TRINITY_DN14138_c0_g1_i1::g.11220::m.11220
MTAHAKMISVAEECGSEPVSPVVFLGSAEGSSSPKSPGASSWTLDEHDVPAGYPQGFDFESSDNDSIASTSRSSVNILMELENTLAQRKAPKPTRAKAGPVVVKSAAPMTARKAVADKPQVSKKVARASATPAPVKVPSGKFSRQLTRSPTVRSPTASQLTKSPTASQLTKSPTASQLSSRKSSRELTKSPTASQLTRSHTAGSPRQLPKAGSSKPPPKVSAGQQGKARKA